MLTVRKLAVVIYYLVLICCIRVQIASSVNLDPRAAGDPPSCIWNNKTGKCVHETICNDDHEIVYTGVVETFDFRESKTCSGLWCCTDDLIPHPRIGAAESDSCLALQSDECPWCVLLYTVADVKPTSKSPFCMGALIGSRVILTASTCLKAALKKMLYVQVPNSADPDKNYTVTRQQFHPDYISGSHEYDFGIIVLDSDVVFENNEKSQGACINFETPSDLCVAYGFDNKGIITSTMLDVTNGSCGKYGNSVDAMCGSNTDEVCIVATGGPVICEHEYKRGMYLVGIARSICNTAGLVLLGNISKSRSWLEKELTLLEIPKEVYT